ncbi:MAG: GAF domain-containing protein, partial [Rhodospirillaceae bacterium]|nr:GAF domain-containing protein [Rhodospirillaceae bacterium]
MSPIFGTHNPSRRMRWGLLGAFVALIAVVTPIAILSWTEIVAEKANEREIERSQQIQNQLRDASVHLVELRGALHDYAVEGSEERLASVRDNLRRANAHIARIDHLLPADRRGETAALSRYLREFDQLAASIIEARRVHGRDAALTLFNDGKARSTIDQARNEVGNRLRFEIERTRQLKAENDRQATTTRMTILISAVASISIFAFAASFAARQLRRREVSERRAREHLLRTQKQLEVAGDIGRSDLLVAGDLEAVAKQVTELAAKTVGCERVNAWLFDDEEQTLYCIDLYEATPDRHSSGMVLREKEYRAEFEAIKTSKFVAADDPLTDPRTAGYGETYIKPLGITSMLDAVIYAAGKNLGLLCFEHVGKKHRWEQDEIAFACQLADKIGLAV